MQQWADGNDNLGVVVTVDESVVSWKKFNSSEAGSNVPTISVTYHAGDINALLANPSLDETDAETIAAIDPTAVDPDVYSGCPALDQNLPQPFDPDVNYTGDLLLDEYNPDFQPDTSYAALVLVHGGGFWRGCRHQVQKEAAVLAGTYETSHGALNEQFIVFAPDYRLACDPSNDPYLDFSTSTNGDTTEVSSICGNYFDTADTGGPDGIDSGPAVHDVENAVNWAKDTAASYCPETNTECFNGKVELVGESSGGNLAFEASGRIGPVGSGKDNYQADAVGSWSGPLRMDRLDDLRWPCMPKESHNTLNCKRGEKGYVDCETSTYPPTTNACKEQYGLASPYTTFQDKDLPRAFFANGYPNCPTGVCPPPPSTKLYEVISLNSAQDFANNLVNNFDWTEYPLTGDSTGSFDFCQVNIDLHVAYIYGDYSCQNETDNSVLGSMVDYLMPAVTT